MPSYPYIPQTYAPNYFQQQQPYYPQVQNPNPSNGNGLIWVQGEQAARSYLVAPNTTVLLMDSESQKFYIKSADASGMPMPIRTFEYAEIKPKNASQTHESPSGTDMSNYVTKNELEQKLAELRGVNNEQPTV